MAKAVLEPGSVIDGFTIHEQVHKGGMATLWRVTHPDHDPLPMLMKVPALHEGEDPAAIVSFEMEQMILPRLSGPHVPRTIAVGDFSVQPYIVMERLEGTSLYPRLKDLPLPYAEVADIGQKVALALHDLHRQHVVHLDIKPSNIIIRPTGEVALVDFGLSRHDQLPDLMDEEFRLPYGTGPYMAPEQVLGVRSEPRSDFFALGCLLYFLSTGVRPFGDPQRLKGLKRRVWWDPPPPRKLKADFPPWLQEVILKCLEVRPEWRYATGAQIAFDLSHPEQVKLTARSEKISRDPWQARVKRRFNPDQKEAPLQKAAVVSQLDAAPIIAVAIDLSQENASLQSALRVTVRRVLETVPGARVACLNVLKESPFRIETTLDEEGHNKHVKRLVELKHWAAPLKIAEDRITFHVLEAMDAGKALLEYANSNSVDHIILGARTNSTMRNILGSVSGEVASQAPCTVTVVRPPRRAEFMQEEIDPLAGIEQLSPPDAA
jgi:serine/threonine protein kinase